MNKSHRWELIRLQGSPMISKWVLYVFWCYRTQGLFTWRWGTPDRWGNPPSRGRKRKRVYMQSYNPGVLGWGFLRLLLRLQPKSLSRGVPSSHLEKDERWIPGHICIYSWKRHALYYAVFGFARNRWLNTLYGIVGKPNVVDSHR